MTAYVVEQAYDDLMKALSAPEAQGDALAHALMRAKQLLTRLDILAQWASLKWEATVQCARVLSACDEEEHALVAAADQLAYLHSELLHTKTPLFDVCSAYTVLAERDVTSLLPRQIWKDAEIDLRKISGFPEEHGLERMMYLLRARVRAEEVKMGVTEEGEHVARKKYGVGFYPSRGSVMMRDHGGLYEAELCLVPAPGVDVVVAKWRLGEAERREREGAAQEGPRSVREGERGGEDREGQQRVDMEVDGGGMEGALEHGEGQVAAICGEEKDVDTDMLRSCASRPEFQWRWRILSVKVLPALELSVTRMSPAALSVIGQQIEEQLWALADRLVLQELGLVSENDEDEGKNDDKIDNENHNEKDKKEENNDARSQFADDCDRVMVEADSETGTKSSAGPKTRTCTSALEVIDRRLRSLSSHVLIGVVVADSARALERGTWKGAIRVGKPPGSNGILIDLWCGIPIVSKDEAMVLETSDVYDEGREFDPSPHYASFAVLLDLAGTLTPTCSPDTIPLNAQKNEDNDRIVAQLCAPDLADGSNNLDRLLLRLTACLASSQLDCIRSCMARQLEAFGNLAVHSSIIYHDNNSAHDLIDETVVAKDGKNTRSEAPRIDLASCGETILSITTNLKTGVPSFMLGSSIAEDGLVCQRAGSIVRSANALLKEEIRGLKTLVLPDNTSTSMYMCAMVAKNALNLCAELVSFVSVRHLLAESPFKVLTACERTPGMLIDASKHTLCYRLDKGDGTVGFLVLQTDFGVLGLQRAKFCVYDADLLREVSVTEEVPGWEDVLSENKRELSGSKRARGGMIGYQLREKMHEGLASALARVEEKLPEASSRCS